MLRIALTVDPELPVPPAEYGGIERIVDVLARGLAERGHEVTLFAHQDSNTAGHLVPWPGRTSRSVSDTARNAARLYSEVAAGRFDLVHSHSRLAYLTPLLPSPIPKLMTYHRIISRRSVRLGHTLSRGALWFSTISKWMMRAVADIGKWRLVYNGVPMAPYAFQRDPGSHAPFVFLGRVEEIKGPHLAIEIARRAGRQLIIAGNVSAEHRGFFQTKIVPHLDGKNAIYAGPVDDIAKNTLLGHARALLMPILWDEPFGLVMAEAMACGTPVLGLARGAVPEVVEDGVTGFVSKDVDGLIAAIGKLPSISRQACRDRAERLFSDTAVVENYLAIYREMLGQPSAAKET